MHPVRYLLVIFVLASRLAPLQAGFLQSYSGNTEAANTTGGEVTNNFAVLDRLTGASSSGDVFGTGFSGFDALTGVDESARYLYLYQNKASGFSNVNFSAFDVGDAQQRFTAITSFGNWNLDLADDNGRISSSNAFGTDNVAFSASAPANLGVLSPSVTTSGGLTPVTVDITISPTDFHASYDGILFAGAVSSLIGFTTNTPPSLIPAGAPSSFFVTGTLAGPTPAPEPTSALLLGIGSLSLLAASLKRARNGKRHVRDNCMLGLPIACGYHVRIV